MTRYQLRDDLGSPAAVASLGAVASRLAAGEVGILPTETVYGLMCLADNAAGRERIYRMKARDGRKPLQILIGGIAELAELEIEATPELASLASFWPGPLTVVVADRTGEEHGVRIPGHGVVLEVLRRLRRPLAATSANRSGASPAQSLASGFADLEEPPDFVVEGGLEVGGRASTVVRLRGGELELLREGELPLAALTEQLRSGGGKGR